MQRARRVFDGEHLKRLTFNQLCRRVAAGVLVIFLFSIVLVVSKFAWDNHRDDVEAAQLLTKLTIAGLPPGATLKDEGSEVGNWVGSSDLLQMMAYRVFTCPLPQEKVEEFYKVESVKIFPQGFDTSFHVVAYGQADILTPDQIVTNFKKAPKSEQPNTYAIYVLDCPTGGFDIRGW